MSAIRILVVDDEPINLEIIADCLEDSGYELTMADTAEAAWEELVRAREPFDLLVLDRMLPGMDGLGLVNRIKSDARLEGLPVIMQTAAATPEQVREGLAAGANYYLTKPFEPETLQTIVRAALDDKRSRGELVRRLKEQGNAFNLLERAQFSVRTLDEAQALAALLAGLCPSPELVVMGLSELLVNGIEHGNLGIDFAEKTRLKESDQWLSEVLQRLELTENRYKRVRLTVEKRPGEWEFLVEDEGPGFDWRSFQEIDPERAFAPNGRGIALARHVAFSELEFLGEGNRVRATVMREPVLG